MRSTSDNHASTTVRKPLSLLRKLKMQKQEYKCILSAFVIKCTVSYSITDITMASSLVLLMLFLVCKTTVQGEILTNPRSLNVSLGSLARFTCEGIGNTLIWTVNGYVPEHVNNDVRGHNDVTTVPNATTGMVISVLEIMTANLTNDNFSIICTAFDVLAGNTPSETAVLRIQGLLPPVVNLTGVFRNFSMLVSWEPPETLMGVPIIGYNVTVYDALNTNLVIYSNTMLTETSFQVAGVELQDCHNYTTTVVAINSVGHGNETSFTHGAGASGGGYPGVPQISNVQVLTKANREDENSRLVNITVQAVGDCPQQYPTLVTVYLRSTEPTLGTAVNLTTISSSNLAVFSGLADAIRSDKHYTLDVALTNTAGSISSSLKATISTFDTQSLMFGKSTTDRACFRCSFLEDSIAVGCLVQLSSGQNLRSPRLSSDDSLSQWACTAEQLRQTMLSLNVFDIESNGTVSTEPALSLQSVSATIIVDIPASSSSGGVVLPTSRPIAPDTNTIPLIGAIVGVVVIITLFVVGVVVMMAVLIRRKAHIQDVNQGSRKDNCKCQDVIFTEANPVYECAQQNVISTAANPLYGGLGPAPVVTNGPVYDTVGNTTEEDSLCKPHLVCDTSSEPSKPPAAAAAEVVYDTVGDGKLSLMDPPPNPITPYATVPNNYITTKH